jgi:Zn-dependent alcohol dehydrogenase
VLQKPGEPLQNVEVLLDGPTDHEVLVRTERVEVGADVIVCIGAATNGRVVG